MKEEVIVETTVNIPSESTEPKGKVEKKGGKRIGYNYIILKSLKEHPKNDVVKCIYIKSFTKFGICVIKEGTAGDTKDKYGRDIKDRLLWQKELHLMLQDKVRVPKYIGSFEENGNYYLAIEHIKGKTLGSLCKSEKGNLPYGMISGNKLGMKFLGYLLKITALLDKLHQHQIVHRDVTSANFMITPGGKAALIDLELSYDIKNQMPAKPFMLGTHGYMSPEQLAVATPTIKEDVFSLAAILLHVWTGIAPIKLTQGSPEELKERINFFVTDKEIASMILQCLHPNAIERPPLKEVDQRLSKYRSDIRNKVNRKNSKPKSIETGQIKLAIQGAINTLSSPLLADNEEGWFAEQRGDLATKDEHTFNKAWYTSFHVGGTGVLYMLSQAYDIGFEVEANRPYINQTLSLIERKYISYIEEATPGLHFGAAGIAACLGAGIKSGLLPFSQQYIDWINILLSKSKSSPQHNILSGAAGQGIANLILRTAINTEETDARLQYYVRYLIENQDKDGIWSGNHIKKEKSKIIPGFANGFSGIIYFLLEYAQQYNDGQAMGAAEKGLHWIIANVSERNGNLKWNSHNVAKTSLWWGDGRSGMALPFIKAFTLSGNSLYKEFVSKLLLPLPRNIIEGNLSQCNGLSGLGEIYLEAYRFLQDEEWQDRAEWIMQAIMHLKNNHTQYGPYWLCANERQPVPGFMQGNAGILHFLMRYCYPEKIGFPMMPNQSLDSFKLKNSSFINAPHIII